TDPTLALLQAAGNDDRSPVGDGEYRSDVHTRAIALAYFERTTPAFMFVSLGDTDEHAHDGDYAGYVEALRGADRFVGDLVGLSASLGRPTVVLVTADHGRADDFRDHGRDHPESARSFLIAAGAGIPARGWVSSPEPRHLADVAPTIAALAGVDFEPDATEHGAPIPEIVGVARPNR
ncbi:MAG TPA: sulfatase-like hydrolase/transferase, partial [Polyangiaceae bacterium]|nr:sulfatase-like hydrolase/transferase [Polyangiaceae bacterium]